MCLSDYFYNSLLSPMKKLILLIYLIPIICQSQENPLSGKSINEIFSLNLRFPSEELRDGKNARVILSLKITDEGKPDSVFLIQGGSKAINDEVIRVVNLVTENWTLDFLEGRPFNKEYLCIVSFSAQVSNSRPSDDYKLIENYLAKNKSEKAIDLCTEKIKSNPYNYLWYQKRSEAFRQMGNTEEAQRDFIASKQIKKQVLVEAEVKAFGMIQSSSTIPGGLRGTNF